MLGGWPSSDPHNFSQFKPNDPSNPSKMTPVTYHPTHDRTLPPPHQVIASEVKNILVRHFYELNADAKLQLSSKRASSDNPMAADSTSKLPRTTTSPKAAQEVRHDL